MITLYTSHEIERIRQRISLNPTQIAEILNRNLCVPLGCGRKKKHFHYLIFSPIDHQCFVVIRDETDGVVITVLPIDFHERISFKISLDAQLMARSLLLDFLHRLQAA